MQLKNTVWEYLELGMIVMFMLEQMCNLTQWLELSLMEKEIIQLYLSRLRRNLKKLVNYLC